MIPTLLLYGATGDLAGRYLCPALPPCTPRGKLPEDLGSSLPRAVTLG